jgi:hypothetical protein
MDQRVWRREQLMREEREGDRDRHNLGRRSKCRGGQDSSG